MRSTIRRAATTSWTILLVTMLLYVVGMGPAIRFAASERATSGTITIVRKMYTPLFRFAPETTAAYLKLWVVTDLEIFFVMQAPKGEQ